MGTTSTADSIREGPRPNGRISVQGIAINGVLLPEVEWKNAAALCASIKVSTTKTLKVASLFRASPSKGLLFPEVKTKKAVAPFATVKVSATRNWIHWA